MYSADKIAFVNAMHGADPCTLAAAGAKRIVNDREVVFNLDRSVRAYLLALHTSNTAVGTALPCNGALFMVGALHDHL